MPRGGGRPAARKARGKRKGGKGSGKDPEVTREVHISLIGVLKRGVTDASLDDSTNEWQQFKPSRGPARRVTRKASQEPTPQEGEQPTRATVNSGKRSASPLRRSPKKARRTAPEKEEGACTPRKSKRDTGRNNDKDGVVNSPRGVEKNGGDSGSVRGCDDSKGKRDMANGSIVGDQLPKKRVPKDGDMVLEKQTKGQEDEKEANHPAGRNRGKGPSQQKRNTKSSRLETGAAAELDGQSVSAVEKPQEITTDGGDNGGREENNASGEISQTSRTRTRGPPRKRDAKSSSAPKMGAGGTIKEVENPAGEAVASPQGDTLDNGDIGRDQELVCPCCSRSHMEIFPKGRGDMNYHAIRCLRSRFNRDADSNKASSERLCQKEDDPADQLTTVEEAIVCLICSRDISHMTTLRREQHVNRCIDMSSTEQPADSTTDDDEEVICQICTKNLSHLNTRKREQHVNRCIDSNPDVTSTLSPDKQEKSIGPPAPCTPKCIICGTGLNTYQKKKNHLKSCALKNNITTIQLLDMIKKKQGTTSAGDMEEKQPPDRVEANTVPENAASISAAGKARPKRGKKPGRKKKKEALDENVQVAMAMSASAAEQEDRERQALGLPPLHPPQQDELNAQPEKGRATKGCRGRKRKENALKFAPLLTRTSPENRKFWAEKVAALVEKPSQGGHRHQKTPDSRGSRLAARFSKKAAEVETRGTDSGSHTPSNGAVKHMWGLTHCEAVDIASAFYVENLKPYVSPAKERSRRKKSLRFDLSGVEGQKDQEMHSPSPPNNISLGPVTQEAVNALVGLANDESQDESMEEGAEPLTCGFIPRSDDRKAPEVSSLNKSQQVLLDSLSDMVDSPELEPLRIITKDDQTLYAHRFILNLRCPLLLKNQRIYSPDDIKLMDFSKAELLAIMRYLYGGDDSFSDLHLAQIEKFANRFQLEELTRICKERLKSSAEMSAVEDDADATYQRLIQSIWNDGDDTGSASPHPGDTSGESQEDPPSPLDMDDIYEHALSQRKGAHHGSKKGTGSGSQTYGGASHGTTHVRNKGAGSSSEETVILEGDDPADSGHACSQSKGARSPSRKWAGSASQTDGVACHGDTQITNKGAGCNSGGGTSGQTGQEESAMVNGELMEDCEVAVRPESVDHAGSRTGLVTVGQTKDTVGIAMSKDIEMDASGSSEGNAGRRNRRGRSAKRTDAGIDEYGRSSSSERVNSPCSIKRSLHTARAWNGKLLSENPDPPNLEQSGKTEEDICREAGDTRVVSVSEVQLDEGGPDSTLLIQSDPEDDDVEDVHLSTETDVCGEKQTDPNLLIPESDVGKRDSVTSRRRSKNVDEEMKVTGASKHHRSLPKVGPPPSENGMHDNSDHPVVEENLQEGGEEGDMGTQTPLTVTVSEQDQPPVLDKVDMNEQKDSTTNSPTRGHSIASVGSARERSPGSLGTSPEKTGRKSYGLRNWLSNGSPLSPLTLGTSNSSGDGSGRDSSSPVPTKKKRGRSRKHYVELNQEPAPPEQKLSQEREVAEPSTCEFPGDQEGLSHSERQQHGEVAEPLGYTETTGGITVGTEDACIMTEESPGLVIRGEESQCKDDTNINKVNGDEAESLMHTGSFPAEQSVDSTIPKHLLVERRWSLRVTSQETTKVSPKTNVGSMEKSQQSEELSPTPGRKRGRPNSKTSTNSDKKSIGSVRVGRPAGGRHHFTKLATKKRGFKFKRKLLREGGKTERHDTHKTTEKERQSEPEKVSSKDDQDQVSSKNLGDSNTCDDAADESASGEEMLDAETAEKEMQSEPEKGVSSKNDRNWASSGDLGNLNTSENMADRPSEEEITEAETAEKRRPSEPEKETSPKKDRDQASLRDLGDLNTSDDTADRPFGEEMTDAMTAEKESQSEPEKGVVSSKDQDQEQVSLKDFVDLNTSDDAADTSASLFDNDNSDTDTELPQEHPGEKMVIAEAVSPCPSSETLQSLIEGDGEVPEASTPKSLMMASTDKTPSLKVNLGRKLSTLHLRSMNVDDLTNMMESTPLSGDHGQVGMNGKENVPSGLSPAPERGGYNLGDDDGGSDGVLTRSPVLALPSPGTSPTAPGVNPFLPTSPVFASGPSSRDRLGAHPSNSTEIEIVNIETGEIRDVQEIVDSDPSLGNRSIESWDALSGSSALRNLGSPRHRSTSRKVARSRPPRGQSNILNNGSRGNKGLDSPEVFSTKIPGIPTLGTLERNGIRPGAGMVTVGAVVGQNGADKEGNNRASREKGTAEEAQDTGNSEEDMQEMNETGMFAFDLEEGGGLEALGSFEVEDGNDFVRTEVVAGTNDQIIEDIHQPRRQRTVPAAEEIGVASAQPQGRSDSAVVLGEIDLTDDEGDAIDLTEDEDDVRTATQEDGHFNGKPVADGGGVGNRPSRDGPVISEEEAAAIPGCSDSFMADLASAPGDEQFWSEQELGLQMAQGNPTAPGSSFKTPTPSAQISNVRSITYAEFHSPAPITPMPPYDEMVTPQLAEQLNRYGIKKLRRKPARLKLKEIYQYTHQVLPDGEASGNALGTEEKSPKKSKKSKKSKESKKRSSPKKKKKSRADKEESTKKKTRSPSKERSKSPVFAEPRKVPKKRGHPEKPLARSSVDMQRSDADLSPEKRVGSGRLNDINSSQSSGSEERDDFGESILHEADEYIPASQVTSDPEQSVFNYVVANPKFFEACLQFQPFDLDEFHKGLKANHIKISKPNLMNILDAMCLTFRNNTNRRRSPKKSPKKSPQKKMKKSAKS